MTVRVIRFVFSKEIAKDVKETLGDSSPHNTTDTSDTVFDGNPAN
jgi:hypothetical protein